MEKTVVTIEQYLSNDGYDGYRIHIDEVHRIGDGTYVPQHLVNGEWQTYPTSKRPRYSGTRRDRRYSMTYKTAQGAYLFLLNQIGEQ